MNAIRCIFILVSLNQLNGSAGNHFYLTSHPNMKEYLENMEPERTPRGPQPPVYSICKMLKESRIFKAADPEVPNFKLLGTDWESLLNFTDPSLVEQKNSTLQKLNENLKKEVERTGNNRICNCQILCLQSPTYEYYLTFNSDITPYLDEKFKDLGELYHYDRLLLIRHVESKESAVLALVQIHSRGMNRISQNADEELGTSLEENYTFTTEKKFFIGIHKFIDEETFRSMNKYHVLNYCPRVLNLFWDWIDKGYEGFPGMADPSQINSVDVSKNEFVFGNLKLSTQAQNVKDTVFLPCTVKHQGGLTTQFHLTPAGGLFLATSTDGENFTLHGHIFPVNVFVKKDG